jgi:perosamine synthetase
VADRYRARLEREPGIRLLTPLPASTPAWFSLPVLVDGRDEVAAGLRDAGVETRSLYPMPAYRQPIPEYPAVASPCEVAEAASARVLNLPLFDAMSAEQVDEVCRLLVELRRASESSAA